MLDHALAALSRGWHIFPVGELGKRPHRLAGDWGQTATSDIGQVIRWWTQAPQANVGVACRPSRLLVVDCDVAKADMNLRGTEYARLHDEMGELRIDGFDVYAVYAHEHGAQWGDFATLQVKTRAGGLHFYYQWPDSWPKPSQASLVKGVVDVRNGGGQYGGYVLAPGSVVFEDGYVGKYDVENPADVILPPQWLRTMVAEKPPKPKLPRSPFMQPGTVSYSGLEESVRNAMPGNRNNALLWAARAMCSDGADQDTAQDVLGRAAELAGLDGLETEQTIRSAYRLQQYKEG